MLYHISKNPIFVEERRNFLEKAKSYVISATKYYQNTTRCFLNSLHLKIMVGLYAEVCREEFKKIFIECNIQ